jgi:hypothetical protein
MERVKLTIRIPRIQMCSSEHCFNFSRFIYCHRCYAEDYSLDIRVCEEMTPAALPSKPKIIHSPTFSSDGSRLRKIY